MLKKRIQSKDGATIVLALLFFIMCAVVGSVVLTAGSASAGRISGISEKEQAYYTVSSAARLIRDEIEGQTISFSVTTQENRPDIRQITVEADSELKELLALGVEFCFNANEVDIYHDNIKIAPFDRDISSVDGAFTMDSNYNIRIKLSLDGDSKDKYKMTVIIPANVNTFSEEKIKDNVTITTTTTKITWSLGSGEIVKG
ncbi:MAG: hypothetical protein PHH48_04290 [Eubacteriales bacterium]|nr:hypothetical protein [Eubacteriales bacterium]